MKKLNQLIIEIKINLKVQKNKVKELDDYRKIYQRPEDRRDFDLNDPDHLKKSLPARVDDDDPRIGLSSAQK